MGPLGYDTNNSTELWGLIRGIQLASELNLQPLIIEGDSKVIITLVTKIINGTDPEKITPSWRLLGPLSHLQALLSPTLMLITSHVRHEANKVADHLANVGVTTQTEILILNPQDHPDSQLLKHCNDLAHQDYPPPDGVPPGARMPHGVLATEAVKAPHHSTPSPIHLTCPTFTQSREESVGTVQQL
jgi:ribonuclease HI